MGAVGKHGVFCAAEADNRPERNSSGHYRKHGGAFGQISNEYITQVAAETLVSKTANGIKEDISKVYTTKDDVSSFRNSIEKRQQGLRHR